MADSAEPVMTERLPSQITAGQVKAVHPRQIDITFLSWLVRSPLLSAEELGRCLARMHSTVYEQVSKLERQQLIESILLAEPGSVRQRRFYATDLGLYTFAVSQTPRQSVETLAWHYPVSEGALYYRLKRPGALICLAEFMSRLVEEGRGQGLTIRDWQQPGPQTFERKYDSHYWQRHAHADAAVLLRTRKGEMAAACLLVDLGHTRAVEERRRFSRLLSYLGSDSWGAELPLPSVLIITQPMRLNMWRSIISSTLAPDAEFFPGGGITLQAHLQRGVCSDIWIPLDACTAVDFKGMGELPTQWTEDHADALEAFQRDPVPLKALLTPARADDAHHRFIVQLPEHRPFPGPDEISTLPDQQRLAQYVRVHLSDQARSLRPADFTVKRSASQEGRRLLQLNLLLSAREKEMLSWLYRQPLLSLPDLAVTLLGTDRPDNLPIHTLLRWGLVHTYPWDEGASPLEKERFTLTERALRWLAHHSGLSLAWALVANPYFRTRPLLPQERLIQRGVPGLYNQMDHTAGVYRCVTAMIKAARASGDPGIIYWQSAHEAIRWFHHPVENKIVHVRPDSAATYRFHGGKSLTFWLEYDRGTMKRVDYRNKFAGFQDYWVQTGIRPPLIIITVATREAGAMIQSVLQEVARRALWHVLPHRIVLEQELLRDGLRALPW